MGTGHSKVSPVSYEEACKRVNNEKIVTRIEEAFRRTASASGYLPQATFYREVVGDAVPEKLSEALYRAMGGTQKGISFKHLLSGLVVLAYGKREEKAKLLSLMVSEDGETVNREAVEALVLACDSKPSPCSPQMIQHFGKNRVCSLESFQHWVLQNPTMASFSEWLLEEESGLNLEGEPDSLTFYQTLAQKYKVSEQDVMDVEKTYWALKGSGKFDLETFQCHISPPLPEELIPSLFRILDVNCDDHLDLSEMVNAVSIWSARDPQTIHSFCFSVFDGDGDGWLSREELVAAIGHLLAMSRLQSSDTPTTTTLTHSSEEPEQNRTPSPTPKSQKDNEGESIADSALREYGVSKQGYLSPDEYVSWANTHPDLSEQLPNLLFEISHVQLGVRPKSKEDEARVVGGYLLRFSKSKRKPGDLVYLITAPWFQSWMEYTGYKGSYPSLSSSLTTPVHHKKHKKKTRKMKGVAEHQATLAPPIDGHVENGEEAIEMADASEGVMEMSSSSQPHTHQHSPAQRSSGLSDASSDAVVLSKTDALKPPPIDNSSLCIPESSTNKKLPSLTNEGGRLVTARLLVEGKDFVLLPEAIWKVFVSWYCSTAYNSIPTLPRVIDASGNVDLYPVFFKLYRHTTLPPPQKPSSLPWFLVSLMNNLGIGHTPTPTPSVPMPSGTGGAGAGEGDLAATQAPTPRRVPYYTAAFDKTTTLAEVSEKVQQMLHVKSEDLRLYNITADENSPVLLEDEEITLESLNFDNSQKSATKEGFKLLIETRNKDNTWPEEMIALVKEVQDKDKAKQKDSQHTVQVQPGATGLSNLGNTCFMNSALQCVSNAKYLKNYFQNKDHLLEINKDNPLGMQGVMAKRYGELINELWNGSSKSITPLKFRFTVGRCAPHFTAFQQQDAQELLAFVLDGLHEDLNRVKEKPYKELKDSDGRLDDEVAQEAWDYHLLRNRSIIVDLFHGQLKSEVTCKVCQYKSVRFDPFTFLSLPLPMESTVNLEVIVMFLDGRQPVKYGLRLEIDEKYRLLKEELGKLCEVPPSRLLLVEMYASNIRSFPSDTTKIRSVLGGWLYAYELPETALLPTTRRSDSPDEKFRQQQLQKVKRERTLSLKHAEEAKSKAARVREKLARDPLRSHREQDEEGLKVTEEDQEVIEEEEIQPKRRKVSVKVVESLEVSGQLKENGLSHEHAHIEERGLGGAKEGRTEEMEGSQDSDEVSNKCLEQQQTIGAGEEGYVFAVHRRLYSVDHFFVSSQKTRPSLFSIPLVVPCTSCTPRKDLYASVWTQMKRLIIPDPPGSDGDEKSETYPFQIKQVTADGMNCSVCPYYRFCQGCVVPCDSETVGRLNGRYLAVDWDNTTLHLKYLLAQEKADDHETMESLKIIDTQPIDLYKCFKAFVREDQLGDEESWYCKKCKAHQEAVKSLEIWRFPPILIIHLKRFQFVNGRWVKSQRAVTFPLEGLDPHRYTVQNGNGNRSSGDVTPHSSVVPEEEAAMAADRGAVAIDEEGGAVSTSLEVSGRQHNSTGDRADSDSAIERTDIDTAIEQNEVAEEEIGSGCHDDNSPGDGGGGTGDGGGGNAEGTTEGGGGGGEESVQEVVLKEETTAEEEVQEGGAERGSADHLPKASSDHKHPRLYNLFATTCHSGVLGGGHYTSFAKNELNGKWYYFNDSSCKETTPERVEQESPYMLFYELQNIEEMSNRFRAADRQGSKQEIGVTDDDREFEETMKSIKNKACVIQ